MEDKIQPYFQPIQTVLDYILTGAGRVIAEAEGLIDYVPVTHLRGDTLSNSYILVDEAQNFNRAELKLIGTRVGEGSKIVYVGDPFQSDLMHNYDEHDNALTILTDRARKEKNPIKRELFSYVFLKKVERSLVADFLGEIL